MFKAATAIFRRPLPLVWRSADKGACWRAVAEVDELHRDHLIDDAGQFPAGFSAFELELPFGAIEIIDKPLEDSDEDHALVARALLLMQPRNHSSRV